MFPHTDITDYKAAMGSVSPGQDVSPGWMAYRYITVHGLTVSLK